MKIPAHFFGCLVFLLLMASSPAWSQEAAVSSTTSASSANSQVSAGTSASSSGQSSVYWGAMPGVLSLVFDPFLPNWNIQEARMGSDYVYFDLRMKSFYAGGGGEARAIFHRRAKELVRIDQRQGYEVMEYSESLESSPWGARRVAHGVIKFL